MCEALGSISSSGEGGLSDLQVGGKPKAQNVKRRPCSHSPGMLGQGQTPACGTSCQSHRKAMCYFSSTCVLHRSL